MTYQKFHLAYENQWDSAIEPILFHFFKQPIVEDMSIILVLDTDLFYSYHPYFLGVYLYFTEKLVSVDIRNQQKLWLFRKNDIGHEPPALPSFTKYFLFQNPNLSFSQLSPLFFTNVTINFNGFFSWRLPQHSYSFKNCWFILLTAG